MLHSVLNVTTWRAGRSEGEGSWGALERKGQREQRLRPVHAECGAGAAVQKCSEEERRMRWSRHGWGHDRWL